MIMMGRGQRFCLESRCFPLVKENTVCGECLADGAAISECNLVGEAETEL